MQLAIFFVAFFILKGLVFAPVMKVLDAREAAVFGAREEAAALDAEVADKKADFEGKMRRIKEDAGKEREAQKAAAQKLARELTDKARTESSATLTDAKSRLDGEAKKVRAEAEAQIPKLAREIAGRLLNRSVN